MPCRIVEQEAVSNSVIEESLQRAPSGRRGIFSPAGRPRFAILRRDAPNRGVAKGVAELVDWPLATARG